MKGRVRPMLSFILVYLNIEDGERKETCGVILERATKKNSSIPS
jgi:hypothetical protein